MTAGRLIGAGATAALVGAPLRVLASVRGALYIESPGGVLALVGPDVPAGAIHLVLDGAPPRGQPGSPALWLGQVLQVAGSVIELTGVREWRGGLPDPNRLWAAAELLGSVVTVAGEQSSLLRPPFSVQVKDVAAMLAEARLAGALDRLAGLGPGLTPAGDDAAAGLLFLERAVGGPAAEPRLVALVRRMRVGPISQGLLNWVARGQTVSPAHELLAAAADRNQLSAQEAARRIVRLGASSGSDFLLGLQWGLEAFAGRARTAVPRILYM